MGLNNNSGVDGSSLYVSGTFGATGQSGSATTGSGIGYTSGGLAGKSPTGNVEATGKTVPAMFYREFNLLLWWTSVFTGTVQLERSCDNGQTYQIVSTDSLGTAAIFTSAAAAFSFNVIAFEPEFYILYRWNCTSYSAGTANYRISQ